AAAVSALAFLAYSTAYLQLEGNWWLPVPIYIEHALFVLFWTGAIAGYWGGLEPLAADLRRWTDATDCAGRGADLPRIRLPSLSPGQAAAAAAITAVTVASIVPAVPITNAFKYPKGFVPYWHEDWIDEPELRQFLSTNIGLSAGHQFRGSAFFYTFQYNEFLTLDNLWVDRVPTANEYSQLVTPQAIYFVHQ